MFFIPGYKIKKYEFDEKFLLSCLPENFKFYVKPYYHQLLSVVFGLQFDFGVGMFHKMGTGKTKIAIDLLRAKGITDKILVITVGAITRNWSEEFKKNSGGKYFSIIVEGSSDNKEYLLSLPSDVYIVNYEGTFRRFPKISKNIRRAMPIEEMMLVGLNKEWNAVIYDESRLIMNPSAIRTKIAMTLAHMSKFGIILTGLPIAKSMEEIFCQQYCVDLGKVFGDNFNKFKREYFIKKFQRYFPVWEPREGAEEEINQKMYTYGMRYTAEECFDLPDKVYMDRSVNMYGDQLRFYNELKAKKIKIIRTMKQNAFVIRDILIKFMQICGGWVKAGEDEFRSFDNNVKLDELDYLINGELQGEKVVIVASFVAEQKGIFEHLLRKRISTLMVKAGMDSNHIYDNVKEFNENPDMRCLVISPRVGGRGISIKASYMIFFSQDFDIDINKQVEDRIYGSGRGIEGKSSIYIRLRCSNSADEKVQAILDKNKNLIDVVVEGKTLEDLI